jgi:S-adenosyl methyltransferase
MSTSDGALSGSPLSGGSLFPAVDPDTRYRPAEPSLARLWDYYLGGKENFLADRHVADQVIAVFPDIVDIARGNRAALERVISFLAHGGIRQFLDIGTGLPTQRNVHEVAQEIVPDARIVYVDNDPVVLAHARALLTSNPHGRTTYLDLDVHNPAAILDHAAETLDFTQPVAVIMFGVLGSAVADTQVARDIVGTLVSALAPGSSLAIEDTIRGDADVGAAVAAQQGPVYHLRDLEEIRSFFDGVELLDPGLVPTALWRPDEHAGKTTSSYCGVARKL